MIDLVLQRLDDLQAELAGLDQTGEVDVSGRVAAMAQALREVFDTAGRGAARGAEGKPQLAAVG